MRSKKLHHGAMEQVVGLNNRDRHHLLDVHITRDGSKAYENAFLGYKTGKGAY